MTYKKQASKLAKVVRKDTGLSLPVAGSMAKYMVRYKPLPEKFREYVKYFLPSCGCCGPEYSLVGPAGEYGPVYSLLLSFVPKGF